jgi:hypothetical protein
MPLLSRRRRAVKFIARSSGSRFVCKSVEIIELEDDEYFDIDDDRISNFKEVGEDIECDEIENVYDEAIPQLLWNSSPNANRGEKLVTTLVSEAQEQAKALLLG